MVGLKTESPSYHPGMSNLRTTNSSHRMIAHLTIASRRNLPPLIQRIVSLKLDELRVIEVKTMFPENSDRSIPLSHFDSNLIIRAITESECPIVSASSVYSFL